MVAKTLYTQVDAAWDSHQAAQTPETEARLYETLIKMANAEAGRRFGGVSDDAAGVALVKLVEALKTAPYAGTNGAKFSTWAQRVINNAVVDEARSESQRTRVERPLDTTRLHGRMADPGLKVEQQERLHGLEASKNLLPPRQRQVVEGRLLGKSEQEIATEMDISQQAVTRLWKKALRRVGNDQ